MAGRFSVEAVFKAVDKVTAPVTRMQNSMRKFTRNAEKNLRSLNRGVDKFVGGLARGAGRLARFGAAVFAAVGTATVVAMNKVADAADNLAKQSRRLQFPIEELQEWKFVAEQSGVSSELLDKSLGAFTKRLGEAKGGIGPLVTGLKNINPELLEQLKQTDSVADAFDIYVNAMRDATTATEKAALANAGFSRAGLNLVNIADNSAEAIKKLRLEQRENGNVTLEQAKAAEAYNDAMNSLKRSIAGVLQGALIPMMPVITRMLRDFRAWTIANKELIQARIIHFLTNFKDSVIELTRAIIDFNKKYNIVDLISSGIQSLVKFARFLSQNSDLILKITIAVVGLSVALKVLTAILIVVNLAMALNPVGLVIAGIIALTAIIWGVIEALKMFGISFNITDKIMQAWSPLKDFFSDLWQGIVNIFSAATANIFALVDKIKGAASFVTNIGSALGSGVAGFLGFGDDDEDQQRNASSTGPQVVSPTDRIARSIEETRTTNTSEVTIRDETGRAEVTSGSLGPGLTLSRSGAF